MLRDVSTVISIILGSSAIVAALGRFFVIGPITRLIDERTHPISPTANGGLSLADTARTAARIEKRLISLERQLDRHIEWHLGEAK